MKHRNVVNVSTMIVFLFFSLFLFTPLGFSAAKSAQPDSEQEQYVAKKFNLKELLQKKAEEKKAAESATPAVAAPAQTDSGQQQDTVKKFNLKELLQKKAEERKAATPAAPASSTQPLGLPAKDISLEAPAQDTPQGGTNISARAPMAPTNVMVQIGDAISINASGSWSIDGGDFFGPDGSSTIADSGFKLSGVKQGALIGKVGLQGAWFLIGSSFTKTFNEAGPLFVTINEKTKGFAYANNKGSVSLNISKSHTQASVDGVYNITFLEDQMRVKVGNTEKSVRLQEIPGKKFQVTEGEIILNPDVLEKIKELPYAAAVRIDKVNIFLGDANNAGVSEKKGIYFPKKKTFLFAGIKEGDLETESSLRLFYATTVSGGFSGEGLSGEIAMSIIASGSSGAAAITLYLPFEGVKS